MAVTARTRQLISEQQKTNRRRRAIGSLKDFSAMLLALKDRKRAIEREEEVLQFKMDQEQARQDQDRREFEQKDRLARDRLEFDAEQNRLQREFLRSEKEKDRAASLKEVTTRVNAPKGHTQGPADPDAIKRAKAQVANLDVYRGHMMEIYLGLSSAGEKPGQATFPGAMRSAVEFKLFGGLSDDGVTEIPGILDSLPDEARGIVVDAWLRYMLENQADFGQFVPPDVRREVLFEPKPVKRIPLRTREESGEGPGLSLPPSSRRQRLERGVR